MKLAAHALDVLALFAEVVRRATPITIHLTAIEGTGGTEGRFIGQQSTARLEWNLNPHFAAATEVVYFRRGESLRRLGGGNVAFLMVSASYRF